ncbi:hypothetical protein EHS25_007274 [Saitozyma podzolica]|uniref:Uncharacterized protein n=1 Tax=Saitozyma podzolica TaxID=1890683 RepID=A0A427XMM2_9TREE|nr:hypothetical protein EHS25_007274 [Saitozyma podzolica]
MTTANALYAARFSDHIPIVFPFRAISGQLGGHDHDIAVSDVFDLDRLALTLGQPIVELHELRQYDNQPDHLKSVIYDGEAITGGDKLGCYTWGQWFGDTGVELFRFRDASWTPLPRSIYAVGQPGQHASFISDIVKFSRFIADAQSVPEESLQMLGTLSVPNPEVLPDPQVFCVDNIYWELEQPERWDLHAEWREGGGVWGTIARHMRFQPALIRLADDYLRYTFGLGPGQEVPPFFAVHIRRGDFPDDWLAMSVNQWAHAAWEAMQDLKRFGIDIKHVVFTTDEQDPAWRDPLLMLGWHFVDHEVARSAERFGYWLPTVLDTVILARATGFLGSAPSTMSILAYRRVVDWNGGLGRWMNYGHEVPEGWVWAW